MITKHTSQAHRVSVLKRLGHLARNGKMAAAEEFMLSDTFADAFARMNTYDRRVTMETARGVMQTMWPPIPPAPRLGIYLDWGPVATEQLRQIASRYGMRPGLDRVIAREMQRPLAACTLARYRIMGRIRAAQPNRKSRNACVSRAIGARSHPSGDPAQNCNRKYMLGAA